jgi:hypothetical protein
MKKRLPHNATAGKNESFGQKESAIKDGAASNLAPNRG